ncbi:hypothetical protein NM208_g6131 [Fusarium decemcellulare]|uniref:Uncharacterized protein n=1 Tax=Fusarium decemcellulare TaxID=57161 RepID=A0ACC1SEA4_9HYPO|nr:hypothetical protein NM208_g6131 [Fusarium decemcellulare]
MLERQQATIEQKTRQAKQRILELVTYLENSDPIDKNCAHGLSSIAVTDVLEKFVLWAGNLGALQGPTTRLSLDYRLSESPEVRDEILMQLEDIREATDDLLGIVCGDHEDRDLTSHPVEEEATDRALMEQEPSDESHMILKVISDAIGSLFRIGILVRRATTRDRFQRALQASDLAFPREFDINYVKEKHRKICNNWLSSRLGGAIAKRRQLIRYCRDHRSRLGTEQTIKDDTASCMEKASSKATTFAHEVALRDLEVEEHDDAVSFTSASTMVDSASLLRLPSLVDLSPEEKPFECPICFTLQTFQREKAWKKHAFRDLKAYVCTLGGGECDDLLFGDRDSWFDHEVKNHRATYTCSLCDGARRISKRDLRSHLTTHGTFTDQQFHILEDAARDTTISLQARDCPFCDEWADKLRTRSISSTRQYQDVVVSNVRFKRHVATHQEQLAIFALPRAIVDDETLDREVILDQNLDSDSARDSTDNEQTKDSVHRGLKAPWPEHEEATGPSNLATVDERPEQPEHREPTQASSYWSVSESNEFPQLLRSFGSDWEAIAGAHGVKNYFVRQRDQGRAEWETIVQDADRKKAHCEKLPDTQIVGGPLVATAPEGNDLT